MATGILILALRHPVFMAKEIASLQFLSGGRFELGVGAGWDAHEFAVAGVKLAERGRRTDEILEIFEKLWTGERVNHDDEAAAFREQQPVFQKVMGEVRAHRGAGSGRTAVSRAS